MSFLSHGLNARDPFAKSHLPSCEAAGLPGTAAALMALRSAGTPCGWRVMGRGYAYMHSLQRSDHGYALTSSAGSDSQSTGWAIAARIKCHMPNAGALAYLGARKHSNGMYSYRTGVVQTPAWVTSQVLPAVTGKAYPIG